jgi:hypothetical protein
MIRHLLSVQLKKIIGLSLFDVEIETGLTAAARPVE